jgi:hypothetical protein
MPRFDPPGHGGVSEGHTQLLGYVVLVEAGNSPPGEVVDDSGVAVEQVDENINVAVKRLLGEREVGGGHVPPPIFVTSMSSNTSTSRSLIRRNIMLIVLGCL